MSIELNDRQIMFCKEFITDFNATRSYLAVYSVKSYGAARASSAKLLAKANIQRKIKQLIEERSQRLRISQDQVVNELAKIAFSNIGEVLEWDSQQVRLKADPNLENVESLTLTDTPNGPSVKIKMNDKLKALHMLGTHIGMFRGDYREPVDKEAIQNSLLQTIKRLGIGSRKRTPEDE